MIPQKLARQLADIFKPPFDGLGVVVWLFFAWCFLVHPHSAILRGEFVDPDDYTYLTYALDWLKGQSWFDTIQYRLSPPEGASIHFSRIGQLPISGLIAIIHSMGLGWTGSAIIAAAIWPLVLFGLLLVVLRWTAASFIPRDWTGVTAYVALFATPLIFQFMPGRVDHHGLALLITILSLGFTIRMIQDPQTIKWSIGAGFFLALGQTIALETLPWLLLVSAFVGLWMMIKGRTAAHAGTFFGLAIYLSSALFLMMSYLPEQWLNPDPLAFSIIYVLLAGSIAVCHAGVALASLSNSSILRYATGVILALIMAGIFFASFPDLITGPYGAMDKSIAELMFDHIMEMQPLTAISPPLAYVLLPIAGLAAISGLLPRFKDELWPQWFLLLILLITAILLTVFYQLRFVHYAALFSIIPLAAFLKKSLTFAQTRWRGRKLAAVELGLILLVGPLPAVFLPALFDGRPFNTGIFLFPVQYEKEVCGTYELESVLNDPKLYGRKSRVIMNTINEGPEILFRTKHKILAHSYHKNPSGIFNAVKFFTSHDESEAKKIAMEKKVELVALCYPLSAVYRRNNKKNSGPTFAEILVSGNTPSWLKLVKLPEKSRFILFETKF